MLHVELSVSEQQKESTLNFDWLMIATHCSCIHTLYHHMPQHLVGRGDLKSLHSELHPVADKWYSLGVQLQVPIEILKCIRRENVPMTECLLEMLNVWLKCTNPPPTWNILTEALESPPVGERLLAQQLRENYCPTTPPDAPLTPQPPTPQPPTPQPPTATPPPEHTGR